MVLVDRDGVHSQSTAVLRVARGLGFPISLVSILLLIPRWFRDPIYAWISRNRYRWFGARQVCMIPTEEHSSRFLDANETREVPLRSPSSKDETRKDLDPRVPPKGWGASLKALAIRFSIVYILLNLLPFPISQLAILSQLGAVQKADSLLQEVGWADSEGPGALTVGLNMVVNAYDQLMNIVLPWIGDRFSLEAKPQPTGSGDRTYDYLRFLFDLSLALVVSLLWTLIRRGLQVPSVLLGLSRVLTRYYLGFTLLVYGSFKIFPLQFPIPDPSRLIEPYGDSSPMGLAWTFLGQSTGYQMFAGAAELFAGFLLFFRRTTLIGSLLSIAVMTNVAAINFFYDVPVKLFSSHLVLLSVFLAAPDLPRLAGLFLFNTPVAPRNLDPIWARSRLLPHAVLVFKLLLIGAVTWTQTSTCITAMKTNGRWAEPSPLTAVYRVESFSRDGVADREVEDRDRWVRIGLNAPRPTSPTGRGSVTIQFASGYSERMSLQLDVEKKTAGIYIRGSNPPEDPMSFSEPEPGILTFQGPFDDGEIVVRLKKLDYDPLLRDRGFNWVNEYPLNR